MIEVENLSKRYGTKLAVDGLSFVVQPGIVTGFLGPNGAGKSTTMRMIAGLDQPTGGRVTVNGGDYRTAAAPMAELGVLLEAKAVHTEFGHRGGRGSVVAAIDSDPSGGRLVQAGDHPHRGGFPGAVRAEKTGDHARLHDEVQSVHRELGAISLAEIFHFDHGECLSGMVGTSPVAMTRSVRC